MPSVEGKSPLAAIDLGSNALRCLIACECPEESEPPYRRMEFVRIPVRLGDDVFTTGRITPSTRDRLCMAMRTFAALMEEHRVGAFRACATSALREAADSQEVLHDIRVCSRIGVEILTGEQEAGLVFAASMQQLGEAVPRNLLYMDVGGGSTETIVSVSGRRAGSRSFRIGTVRLLHGREDTEEFRRFWEYLAVVRQQHAPETIVASGGNINKIGRLLRKERLEPIRCDELQTLCERLAPLSAEQRTKCMDLTRSRAETIVPALKIFLAALAGSGASAVVASGAGLADGIVLSLCGKR